MSFARSFAAVCAGLALTGCASSPTDPVDRLGFDPADPAWARVGDHCSAASPAENVPAERLAAAPNYSAIITVDDQWNQISRLVPGGWGGFVYESGRPTMFLVDPGDAAAARAALEDLHPLSAGAEVRRGRWSFAQLYDWYRVLNAGVVGTGLVHLTDIDEARNRVTYAVRDDAARQALEAHLRADDAPCFLVGIRISAPPTTE